MSTPEKEAATPEKDLKDSNGENPKNYCNKCKNYVDTLGVECGICHQWAHYGCVGIPTSKQKHSLLQNEQVHWFCNTCNGVASDILKSIG